MLANFFHELGGKDIESYKIKLVAIKEVNHDLFLYFDIVDELELHWIIAQWEIKCYDYVPFSHKVDLNYYSGIDIFDAHIFKWDISEDRYELYFSSAPNDINNFLGELYIEHKKVTKGLIPFGKYINDTESVGGFSFDINIELILSGHGLFAEGPEPILKSYSEILSRHNMRPSLLLNNLYYQQLGKTNDFKVLVFDKSYVIAKNFVANKITKNTEFT